MNCRFQTIAHSMLVSGMALFPKNGAAMPPGDGGIEIWVDGPAEVIEAGDRDFPDVAVDPQGRSIFVWQDSGTIDTSTPRTEIFLRRFDAAGSALADPVIVNTLTEDDQVSPRIALGADGSFLVIWQSDEPDPEAEGAVRRFIRGQAFDADAQPVGGERIYNAVTTGTYTDRHADVAALTGGGFVVVWQQETAIAPDTGRNIQARLVAANGAPSGDAFVANSAIGASESLPAVTELDDGGFFVMWRSGSDLNGRRFDAAGMPIGDEFQINTQDIGTAQDADATRGPDGRVLVVWEDGEAGGDGAEIRGRLFGPTLESLGEDFRINTLTESNQSDPRTAAYGNAGFLVVWHSSVSAGNDPDGSIEGRMVTGVDQFGSPQFLVNRHTPGGQFYPAVGGFGDTVSIVHTGPAEAFEVINDDAIIGQTWSICGIFCDGFE